MYQYLFHETDQVVTGLVNERTLSPLSFLGAQITVAALQFAARVTVVHHYRNANATSVDAAFVFPFEENWTVHDFHAELENRTVRAETQLREKTNKEYRDSAFIAGIGSVEPGGFVTARISFIVNLTHVLLYSESKSVARFHLSNKIIPHFGGRVASSEWQSGFAVPSKRKIHRGISIDISCLMDHPVTDMHCNYSSKEMRAKFGKWYKCEINLTGGNGVNSKDIAKTTQGAYVARAKLEFGFAPDEPITLFEDLDIVIEQNEPRSLFQLTGTKEQSAISSEETYAFLLSVVPYFDEGQVAIPNAEIVFAVDCSGSMTPLMEDIRRVVSLCLQGLPQSARFNIALYGETCKMLSETECLSFNAESLSLARHFVSTMDADLGSTNLLVAMKAINALPIARGYCRQILLLTDGCVKQPYEVISIAKKNARTTRILPMVMRAQSSDIETMERLAFASNGRATFLAKDDVLAEVVLCSLDEMLRPALTDPQIHYSYEGATDSKEETVPPIRNSLNILPPMFHDTRYVIQAFGAANLAENAVATLSAWFGGQEIRWTCHIENIANFPVNDRKTTGHYSILHTLAATNRVRELTEYNPRSCPLPSEEREVIHLSSTFNIVSPLTCMVAQHASKDPSADSRTWSKDLQLKGEIACEYTYLLPRHDREVQRVVRPKPPQLMDPPRDSLRIGVDPDFRYGRPVLQGRHQKKIASITNFMEKIVQTVVDSVCQPATIDDILFQQNAQGCWTLNFNFARVLNLPMADLVKVTPPLPEGASFEVPAIRERDRLAEEERAKAEELKAAELKKEEEKAMKKAMQELEKQKREAAARAKLTEEELKELEAKEKKKKQEDAEKAQQEAVRAEKERKEKAKEEDKLRKKLDAERKKLVKKLGEDAVRAQEEAEAAKAAAKIEKQRLQAEAVLKRVEDARVQWEGEAKGKFVSDIWATALALAYLSLEHADVVYEFQLAARRAVRWLNLIGVSDFATQWPQLAADYLAPIIEKRRREKEEYEAKLREEADRLERELIQQAIIEGQQRMLLEQQQQELYAQQQAAAKEERQGVEYAESEEETEETRRRLLEAAAEEERMLAELANAQNMVEEDPNLAGFEPISTENVPMEGDDEMGMNPPAEEGEEGANQTPDEAPEEDENIEGEDGEGGGAEGEEVDEEVAEEEE